VQPELIVREDPQRRRWTRDFVRRNWPAEGPAAAPGGVGCTFVLVVCTQRVLRRHLDLAARLRHETAQVGRIALHRFQHAAQQSVLDRVTLEVIRDLGVPDDGQQHCDYERDAHCPLCASR
jgi:hypothetical protein